MLNSLFKLTIMTFFSLGLGYVGSMAFHVSPAWASIATSANNSDTEIPQLTSLTPESKNDIRYLTGGIGDGERDQIEAARSNYNFHLMLSTRDGAFVGNSTVSIDNAKGNVLPETDSGPLFYASLPPGSYTISITHNGMVKQRRVTITQTKPVYLAQSW